MLFLIFGNANIQFAEKKLTWRSYIATEALSTIKWVKVIDKKEFAKTALDKKSETFMVHVAALEAPLAEMTIHFLEKVQILALI